MSFGFEGGRGAVSGLAEAMFTCEPDGVDVPPRAALGKGPSIGSSVARNPGDEPLARRTFEDRFASVIGGFGEFDASITAGCRVPGQPQSAGTSLLMRSMRPS